MSYSKEEKKIYQKEYFQRTKERDREKTQKYQKEWNRKRRQDPAYKEKCRVYALERYRNNKSKLGKQSLKYWQEHKQERAEYSKKYTKRTKNTSIGEKRRAYGKEYRIRNKQHLKEKRVEYYKKNKQDINRKGRRANKEYYTKHKVCKEWVLYKKEKAFKIRNTEAFKEKKRIYWKKRRENSVWYEKYKEKQKLYKKLNPTKKNLSREAKDARNKASTKFRKKYPEYYKEWYKKYTKTDKGRDVRRRASAKTQAKRQRNLGWNPLNEWFKGSHGHHINNIDVVFIPSDVHIKCFAGIDVEKHRKKVLDFYGSIENMLINKPR